MPAVAAGQFGSPAQIQLIEQLPERAAGHVPEDRRVLLGVCVIGTVFPRLGYHGHRLGQLLVRAGASAYRLGQQGCEAVIVLDAQAPAFIQPEVSVQERGVVADRVVSGAGPRVIGRDLALQAQHFLQVRHFGPAERDAARMPPMRIERVRDKGQATLLEHAHIQQPVAGDPVIGDSSDMPVEHLGKHLTTEHDRTDVRDRVLDGQSMHQLIVQRGHERRLPTPAPERVHVVQVIRSQFTAVGIDLPRLDHAHDHRAVLEPRQRAFQQARVGQVVRLGNPQIVAAGELRAGQPLAEHGTGVRRRRHHSKGCADHRAQAMQFVEAVVGRCVVQYQDLERRDRLRGGAADPRLQVPRVVVVRHHHAHARQVQAEQVEQIKGVMPEVAILDHKLPAFRAESTSTRFIRQQPVDRVGECSGVLVRDQHPTQRLQQALATAAAAECNDRDPDIEGFHHH